MASMDRPAKRARLLADESSSEDSSSEEKDGMTNGFKVNEEFARRFEHNKKREEMHRLEEKYTQNTPQRAKDGAAADDEEDADSESDESEDDEGDLATRDVDEEISATLNAIRNKDPRVYDKSVTFYKEFDVDAAQGRKEGDKERPLYLQDYHRENLLAGYTGEEDDESESAPATYDEEQDAVRRQLVDSMHTTSNGAAADEEEGSDDEDFLVSKSTIRPDTVTSNGVHPARASRIKDKSKHISEHDVASAEKDPETYLSNFMAARAWVPTSTSRWQAFDSDDSDEEKRADEFEEAYNMRFENPDTANEKLLSFSRDVGKYSVRRQEKSGRQKARDKEREAKEHAKVEREEERARLRKLKIEEAEEKVRKIKEAAGMRGGQRIDIGEWKEVLEGDFDDDSWEKEMKRRFGEEYYAEDDGGEEDEGQKGKVKKPKWEDDIDIDDLVPEFEKEEQQATFTLSSDDEDVGATRAVEESGQESDVPKAKKGSKERRKERAEAKWAARRERRQIESLVDSILPLSHPSLTPSNPATKAPVVGFRYRDTSPTSFGLSASDILFANDKQLNEYAGLKKMAAFRDADKKKRDRKKYSKKARLREWRKEVFGRTDGVSQPVGGGTDVDVDGKTADVQDSGKAGQGNVVEGQRGKKRKRKGKGKETKA